MSLWLNDHPKRRKTIMAIVLVVFVFQIALTPQFAYAQLVVADPGSFLQRAVQWIKDGAEKVLGKSLSLATWKAFQTALQRFLGRIAYETAVWIGSGDKGKKPLLYTKGWKQYIEDAGDAAAGDFIETLADEWSGQADRKKTKADAEKNLAEYNQMWDNRECSRYGPGSPEYTALRKPPLGSKRGDSGDSAETSCESIETLRFYVRQQLTELNTAIARTAPFLAAICTPPDGIQLKIALGLGTPTNPKGANCSFSQMRENWETAVDDPAFLDKFSVSFNPSQSDLGIALDLQSNLLTAQDKASLNAGMTRAADGSFKAVTSTVTGLIQTPGRMVDDAMRKAIEDANTPQKEAPPPGLLEGVATVFTNTLVSSLADRMKKGFWSLRETAGKKKNSNLKGRVSPTEVEEVFASLKEVKLQGNSNFDIVSQFQQCPSELKQQLSVYSCVLDDNFADAVRRGAGQPMTVREAMDEGLLHSEWNFGYDDPAQRREPIFNTGYAYSSMVKLRRFRILPVGWEFAAQYIKNRNQVYNLQHVVDCYEDKNDPSDPSLPLWCREDTSKDGTLDTGAVSLVDKNPFWHLVDPNWVLKAPQLNCRAWGAGQQIYKDTGQRLDYCADVRDCVVENENGTCAAEWYCTREKNVWKFAGDKCDAQYDTCLAVQNDATDEGLSALQSSWDRTGCTAQTSGCAAHAVQTYNATKKNTDGSTGAWMNNSFLGERFLTSQAATCSERAVGCRAFIEPRAGVNLVPNGMFEEGVEGELPKGWQPLGSTFFTKSLPIAQRGQSAAIAKDFAGLMRAGAQKVTAETEILGILSEHTYTVSAWAYLKTAPTNFGNIGLRLTRKQGTLASASLDVSKTNQWQEVRFGAPIDNQAVEDPKLLLVADAGAEVFWDDVSVQEGGGGSIRPYGEGGLTYLRWTDATIPALSCTRDEVGCALYTPENGDPARAGILSSGNLCPNQCVGYATFDQLAPKNKFDDERRGVDLIPSTAKTCPTEDVGCDEFTNLDEVAKGGEGLTYFTEIRQCQTPASADCAPFYTYEGSATSGAQLQSYSLKAAVTGDPATTDGVNSNCTRLPESDLNYNANCRDFINAQGKHSFRDITKTVTCANDCHPFRKTNSNSAQCSATGGEWSGNACTYDVIPSEGKQCAKQANGCRAYSGNTGHVLRTVAREDFERGRPSAWQTLGTIDTESARSGGHSLTLNAAQDATWILDANTLKDGAQYTVTFLAKKKDSLPLLLTLRAEGSGATQSFTTSKITASGWHDYTLGSITGAGHNKLVFNGSGALYLDDVFIRRTNDQYALIKDSWNTPVECTGATIGCQAYRDMQNNRVMFSGMTNSCAFEKVGCNAFINTQNSTSPFSETWNGTVRKPERCVGGGAPGRLCRSDADCGTGGTCRDRDFVQTEKDEITYLINRPDYACSAAERGCTAFETKVSGKDGKPEARTTFLRDDPDLYGSALCSTKAEGCSTYTGDGGPFYFRDPKEKLCEYRTIPGTRGDAGWFKKGSMNLKADCEAGWAKLCPDAQSQCTKFVDPIDTNVLYPNGYEYFALKNENLDTGSCGTAVDRRRGCVLLSDTTNASATYSGAMTNDGSDTPVSACVNPQSPRSIALNIPTKPNEDKLEFSGTKNVSVMKPVDAIAIEMKPEFVDHGSYMVEFEAKPRRIIGQTGPARVRVALETVAPGTTSPSSTTPAPAAPNTPPVPGVNLVPNGGFEGAFPGDWRDGSTGALTKTPLPAPRVPPSTITNDFAGRVEAVGQQITARTRVLNALSQQTYTMSAWGYIETAPDGGGVVQASLVELKNGFQRITLGTAGLDASKLKQWQEVRFNGTTDVLVASVDEVRPELIVDSGGVVFWDDVSITLTPSQTQTGGTPPPVAPPVVRVGGGSMPVGTALVAAGGWNRYVVGPVKINRALDMTGKVVFDIPADVVAIEKVTVTLACDANVILKVTRDRTCGEWLYCKSSVYLFDNTIGKYSEVCTELGRCKEANPDNPKECNTPVETTSKEQVFSREFYQNDLTHAGWAGLDYTGHSIPGIYPVETLQQITRSPTKLTYVERQGKTCKIDTECEAANAGDLCLNNVCYKNKGIDGLENADGRKGKECRLYPETTSPLPSSLGIWLSEKPTKPPTPPQVPPPSSKYYDEWVKGGGATGSKTDYYTFLDSKKTGFTNSEVCQPGEDCECSYKKVLYANGEDRYYAETGSAPYTLMQFEIDRQDSADEGSLTKYKKKREDTYLGWRGYCLESDPNPLVTRYSTADSKPCFTWWPVDVLQGEVGLFSNHPEAGFQTQNQYYCLASAWQEHRQLYQIQNGRGMKKISPKSCDSAYTQRFSHRVWAGFTQYKYDDCDPIGGAGWYPYDGSLSPGERVGPSPRRVCTDIAQIGNINENKAQTSRVKDVPVGAFKIPVPPATGPVIEYDATQKPYGALLLPGDPTLLTEYLEIPVSNTTPQTSQSYSSCDSLRDQPNCKSLSFETNKQLRGSGLTGADVLKQLFAQSYGIFAAPLARQDGDGECTGVCYGGPVPGDTCTNDTYCAVRDQEKQMTVPPVYTCETETCMYGAKRGEACAIITPTCAAPGRCGADGLCIDGGAGYVDYGKACTEKGRCSVDMQLSQYASTCNPATLLCVGGPLDTFPCTLNNPESCSVNEDAVCSASNSTSLGGATAACAHQGSVAGELSGLPCIKNDPQFGCIPQGKCSSNWKETLPTGTKQDKTAYCSNQPAVPCATPGPDLACKATAGTLLYQPIVGKWDVTGVGEKPVIAAVVITAGQLMEGPHNQVTINGDVAGNLVSKDGSVHASLRFYAYNENGNQMPLKKITVKWGDNTVTPVEGKIQNHKNVCRKEGALVCAVDASCKSVDPTKPCSHMDIVVDPAKITSTTCTRDTTTNTIREGTPCTAYTGNAPKAGTGLCYQVDKKPAFNFGDTTDACVDDRGIDAQGYFVFNHDYTKPGIYNVSVVVEDNWGRPNTATYSGTITVNKAP